MTNSLHLDRINPLLLTNRVQIANSTRNYSEQHGGIHNSSIKFRMTQRVVRASNNKKMKSEAVSPQCIRINKPIEPNTLQRNMRKSVTFQKDSEKQSNLKKIIQPQIKNIIQGGGRLAKLGNHSPEKIKIKTNGLLIQNLSTSVQKSNSQSKYVIHTKRKFSQQSEQKIWVQQHHQKIDDASQLTAFEQQQVKKFEVYYKGKRRINEKNEFTDIQGNSLIEKNDAIAYRYQILQQLGRGAFGKVYKTYDHKKNQQVALKIIKAIPKLNKQAKIEVQILQTVVKNDADSKSNIVKIKGFFVFRGHSCITYEILSINLYQYLKLNRFKSTPNNILTKFAIQILHSLHFLHSRKIVHCDIKPQNIMLKQSHKTGVRLIDLGSGCFESQQFYTYIQSRFYRAPEVILGIKYTTQIDMWSFGCVLCELYTGYPLFPGENQDQQLMMFIQLLGYPPNWMLQQGLRRKRFFNDNFQCRIVQSAENFRLPKGSTFQKALQNCSDRNFIQFIKRCICWQPSKRITPKEALLHEWILQGIPQNIKARHIVEVTGEGLKF